MENVPKQKKDKVVNSVILNATVRESDTTEASTDAVHYSHWEDQV